MDGYVIGEPYVTTDEWIMNGSGTWVDRWMDIGGGGGDDVM